MREPACIIGCTHVKDRGFTSMYRAHVHSSNLRKAEELRPVEVGPRRVIGACRTSPSLHSISIVPTSFRLEHMYFDGQTHRSRRQVLGRGERYTPIVNPERDPQEMHGECAAAAAHPRKRRLICLQLVWSWASNKDKGLRQTVDRCGVSL